jgi:MoxR-like ATPase
MTDQLPQDRAELAQRAAQAYQDIIAQVAQVIVGQERVVEQSLITLFAQGHCIFVGVPGLAKTLLVSTTAQALGLDFNRIQFTPDLMPSDITGTDILREDPETGSRSFEFLQGPIFTNLLLADELNRTPPKTQAALLQAMQERQVTASGRTYQLDQPFLVFATQNPVEQEGTYQLPEAQLDRFMLMIQVGYPSLADELEVVRRTTRPQHVEIKPALSHEELIQYQELVRELPAADEVISYAVRLTRATRPDDELATAQVRRLVRWGAGPRAGQSLILAAKARALLQGRLHASRDDVKALAHAVLTHRVLVNYQAEAEGVTAEDIVTQLLEEVQRG